MINLDIIEKQILEMEMRCDTTFAACERLAWLYIVRDHLRGNRETQPAPKLGGTEFLDACSEVPYLALMGVLDEHMTALSVVQPREYESIMSKLRALKSNPM